jgi:hypothetical protein
MKDLPGEFLKNDVYRGDMDLAIKEDRHHIAAPVKSSVGRKIFFWITMVLGNFYLLDMASGSKLPAWFFGDLMLWGVFIFLMCQFVSEGRYSFGAMIILLVVLVLFPFNREVLRGRVLETKQKVTVAAINASGAIEAAGWDLEQEAADFLKKLFGAGYVQELVTSMSAQTIRESSRGLGYNHFFELALKHISKGEFDAAWVYAHKAAYIGPNRPEACNLLGGLCETRKNLLMAEKYYRDALALNSSYKPAQKNLDRVSTRPYTPLGIDWGL